MTRTHADSPASRRHDAAVARSLGWADEAAERADWACALEWVEVVQACGDELSAEFRAKRDRWRQALNDQSSAADHADRRHAPG